MKEATWDDCVETAHATTITPDHGKARSLVETAHARLEFLQQPVTEENANFIFEGKYSSLLELLHAQLLKKGIRADNHICVGFYLRDVLKRDDLFRLFDDCRYKRNSLVYYGKRMPLAVATESLEELQKLIDAVESI